MTDNDFGFDRTLLLYALGAGRGTKGFTIDEGVKLMEWAAEVVIANELLCMALAGDAVVTGFSIDGEPLFTTPDGRPAVADVPDARIPYPFKRLLDAADRFLDAVGFAGEDGSQDAVVLDNCDAACSLRRAIWALVREAR